MKSGKFSKSYFGRFPSLFSCLFSLPYLCGPPLRILKRLNINGIRRWGLLLWNVVMCFATRRDWRESTCSESVTWYWGCFCLRLRFLSCKVTAVSITPFLCLKMLFFWCARFLARKLWEEILVTNSKKVYDVEASISQWHLKFARWGIPRFVWAGSLASMTSATKPQFFRVVLYLLLGSGISYRNWILTIMPPQQGFATRASNLTSFTSNL